MTDGNVVGIWETGDAQGHRFLGGRLFSSGGVALGEEFRLDAESGDAPEPRTPRVIAHKGGDFTVVWSEYGPGTVGNDIFAQPFTATGNAGSAKQRLNTRNTIDDQLSPTVAAFADGGFVATWVTASPQTAVASGVFARRFDGSGHPVDVEFGVNHTVDLSPFGFQPSITTFDNGGFVIAYTADGDIDNDIFVQRFDANGEKAGNAIRVNQGGHGHQLSPDVATLDNGDFVVAWSSALQDDDPASPGTDGTDVIYARRFTRAGLPRGDEILVNEVVLGIQTAPTVAALADGGFVVSWDSNRQDGDGFGISRRLFGPDAKPAGPEQRVNQITAGSQSNSAIAALPDGGFTVLWETTLGDNISARTFERAAESAFTIDVLANDIDASDDIGGLTVASATVIDGPGLVDIVDNEIRYVASNELALPRAGEQQLATIAYTVVNENGEASASHLTLQIRGTEVTTETTLDGLTRLVGGGNALSGGDLNADGINDLLIADRERETVSIVFGHHQALPSTVDLTALDPSAGVSLNSSDAAIDFGFSVTALGDINGDGVADLAIGAPGYDGDGRVDNGAVYLVHGGDDLIDVALDDLDGSRAAVLIGADSNDGFGYSVGAAGDINGDGIDDFAVGAPEMFDGRGGVLVYFGSAQARAPIVDLAGLHPANGFWLYGEDSGDGFGHSLAAAGDVNGDGIDDLLIGAPSMQINDAPSVGGAYLIYGKRDGFDIPIDLSLLSAADGMRITTSEYGENSNARIATALAGVGDINNDGLDDVLVGAPGSRVAEDINEGRSYLIFGNESQFGPAFDLAAIDGDNGVILTHSEYGWSGQAVSSAGDPNGDGIADLIIGAPFANAGSIGSAGAVHVVYGRNGDFPATIDLDALDGRDGFRLLGAGGEPGASLAALGDINGDGFDDVLIGAPGSGNDGESFVLYGRDFTNAVDYLGTDAADEISAAGNNLVIFSGAGDDRIDIEAANTVAINPGSGTNSVSLRSLPTAPTTIRRVDIRHSPSGTDLVEVHASADERWRIESNGRHNGTAASVWDLYTGNPVSQPGGAITAWREGSLILDINDGQLELRFTDVDINRLSAETAPFAEIRIDGAQSITFDDVLRRGLDITGTKIDDTLSASDVDDRLVGYAGDDLLRAGKGNDRLNGGPGADVLIGGAGDDVYLVNRGDGADTIGDVGGNDRIVLGPGINVGDVISHRSGDDLVLSVGAGDSVTIDDWYRKQSNRIESVEFSAADGFIATTTIDSLGQNHNPMISAAVATQHTAEGTPFSFEVPRHVFSDPDFDDALTFTIAAVDGSALPPWLTYTPATNELSGIAGPLDVGLTELTIIATDTHGASVVAPFAISVDYLNDAPFVAGGLPDVIATEDVLFSYTVPADAFDDTDLGYGDSLLYTTKLTDGSELPPWLVFDSASASFHGTPRNTDVGELTITVNATDIRGLSTNDNFKLTIANANDTPMFTGSVPDLSIDAGTSIDFAIPDIVSDDDRIHGDTLLWRARLSSGGALPDWLEFDAAGGRFHLQPAVHDIGSYVVQLDAIDRFGALAATTFELEVTTGAAINIIAGTNKSETIEGTEASDDIDGKRGHDVINGLTGSDRIIGGRGNDKLFGGAGDDVFIVEGFDQGVDQFYGGDGFDVIRGGDTDDRITIGGLNATHGVEQIEGGDGFNVIAGGHGNTVFDFSTVKTK